MRLTTLPSLLLLNACMLFICTKSFGQEVVFSHAGKPFSHPFTLELSSPPGTNVYFTLDGQAPNTITATPYALPLEIDSTLVIRAAAFNANGSSGPLRTMVYTRTDTSLVNFSSDLPILILHQFDQPIAQEERSIAYLNISEINSTDGRCHLLDAPSLQTRIETNIRGNTSADFPKKQYATRLIDEGGNSRDESLLGMPADNNWILHAPFSDKTLMRNVVAFQLARSMGWYAPRIRYVELFLHSGHTPLGMEHYNGVYAVFERIKWHEERVDISKPGSRNPESLRGGYIFQIDREPNFETEKGSLFQLVRPQAEEITFAQLDWLTNHIDEAEKALFSDQFADMGVGYPAYLHAASFIDHHLLTELLKEIDGFRLSTYFYKDRDDKIVCGPLWDFNLSLGNAEYNDGWNPQGWYHEQIDTSQYLYGWYNRLFADSTFAKAYKDRWWYLRQNVLSQQNINALMQHYTSELAEAQARNFARWDILGYYVWPNPPGYEERNTHIKEVHWMINWINARLAWMDQQLGPAVSPELLYYWYFGTNVPNDTPLQYVPPLYSTTTGAAAQLEFRSARLNYPNHSQPRKGSMERRNSPTMLNYKSAGNGGSLYDKSAMRGIQVRQPFQEANRESAMVLHVPVVDYKDIKLSFTAKDEGAADGFMIDYSVGLEEEWLGLDSNAVYPLFDAYRVYHFDFTEKSEVNNSAFFKIRLRFVANNMAADNGDRVTFNNFAVYGEPNNVSQSMDRDFLSDVAVYPNPFQQALNFDYKLSESGVLRLELFDVLGRKVLEPANQWQFQGDHRLTMDGSTLGKGLYIYKMSLNEQSITGSVLRLE